MPLRILVIDDSAVMRSIITRILEQTEGFQVIGSAEDIAHSRELSRCLNPDLITVDLAMPDVDGIQYLDEIRGSAHPAIVIVSASTRPGSAATMNAAPWAWMRGASARMSCSWPLVAGHCASTAK